MHPQISFFPLSFFPPALPDETLIPRVSRYHIISGNSTHSTTLTELFQQLRIGLSQVVPPYIEVLASRLPGDTQENLQTIIQENTLFPLFLPFIGRAGITPSTRTETWYGGLISHMPRRVVGKHGESCLCQHCLREDESEQGLAYWHRAHQAPGVTVCWKHKAPLISSCPNCRLPFERKGKLLDAPWVTCRCDQDLRNGVAHAASLELEHAFAVFVHDLNNRAIS